MYAPIPYDYKMTMTAVNQPNTVHCQNTTLVHFYERYLLQKVLSCYEFINIPDHWAKNYFLYSLFCNGFVSVIKTDKYGVIPQHCTLYGRNVMYQPTHCVIANPLLGSLRPQIGVDCALIQMQPDYGGIMDLVGYYADMLALHAESAGYNILNSRLAYVFISRNKAGAESFKKMFDEILSGNPGVFLDKELLNEHGEPNWMQFNQDLKRTYIANDILNDMIKWEARFDTDIGIPNVNITKASGVSDAEVQSNNVDTAAKVVLWLEMIRKGLDEANRLFNTAMGCELRFNYGEEVPENGSRSISVDTRII